MPSHSAHSAHSAQQAASIAGGNTRVKTGFPLYRAIMCETTTQSVRVAKYHLDLPAYALAEYGGYSGPANAGKQGSYGSLGDLGSHVIHQVAARTH